MRLLRLSIAILILRGAGIIAATIAGSDLNAGTARPSLRPVEQMLLGSIVGLSICLLWIWISARAGQ